MVFGGEQSLDCTVQLANNAVYNSFAQYQQEAEVEQPQLSVVA